MTILRCCLAGALLLAAAGCGGHKTDTQTTTSTTATNGAGSAATPSSAMSASGMNGTTTGGAVNTGARQPPGFDTESGAQAHCPSDVVVWLNTNSRVYHLKGQVYYGHTKAGAYVCKKEADADGDRETQNGK
ncbi:MAG TPA: hypothetical protein VHS78_03180 [Candidatus Elarobacter sp.]|jgi:hypothetical protein|nr:hypothetical protein [Candidatus Elarobacter sp.]